MEKVLDVNKRPYNPVRRVVCMDESPKQLIDETRVPIPMSKEHERKCDYEYKLLGFVISFSLMNRWPDSVQ